ncbi:MAG: acyl-CoA desaturase [Gammaproteobacteria bacterium]
MKELYQSVLKWFMNDNTSAEAITGPNKIDWLRALPFIALNLSCLFVFWVGYSKVAFLTGAVLYFVRVFSIGAFYHRYFSHRTYKTNRFWQFIFAILGASAVQRGPLWWATYHRQHHMIADQEADAHSPVQHGFWWSHMGWFMSKKNYYYNPERVTDLTKFPELVFLDRFDGLVPFCLAASLFVVGTLLHIFAPSMGVTGGQMIVWGFCISTIAVFHTTVSINSLSHKYGKRRFTTKDNSRNNLLLALITLGEGWHNNHHHYPGAARQGFMWWEVDITYYMLKLFEKLGIIWDVRPVPSTILQKDLA